MRSESKNAFSAVLSTEGRVVGLSWAQSKLRGPKGPDPHATRSFLSSLEFTPPLLEGQI